MTDGAGRATVFAYDAAGERLLTATAPGSHVTTYAYKAATGAPASPALLSITYPDTRGLAFAYDSLGRLAQEQLAGGTERVTYTYDGEGRNHVPDGSGEVAVLAGRSGRPTLLQDALGRKLAQEYGPDGTLAQVTGPGAGLIASSTIAGATSSALAIRWDIRPRWVTTPVSTRCPVLTIRGATGRLSATMPRQSGNHDLPQRRSGEVRLRRRRQPPDLHQTRRRGDDLHVQPPGQLLQKTHAAAAGTTTADAAGSDASYTYDAAGNMTSATNAQGTIQMQYDVNKTLLTRISYPDGHWFSFTYDTAGRRTQRTGDDGFVLNYTYDDAGRLWKLTNGAGQALVTYEYDGAGRLVKENKGNGTYTTYDYDAAGQVLHLVNYASGGAVQSRFDYTYDANGNRTSMTTLDGVTSYAYRAGAAHRRHVPGRAAVAYAYDPAGNRMTVTDNGTVDNYTTNNLNQYTQAGNATYTYDANGNAATRPMPGARPPILTTPRTGWRGWRRRGVRRGSTLTMRWATGRRPATTAW